MTLNPQITGYNQRNAAAVIDFYQTVVVLKEIIRSGWKQWNVKQERLESIAEHVCGTCMLAAAMASEFKYDIDLKKVVMMLALHELEEAVIPDITPMDGITPEEKLRIGHEAVTKILSPLASGEELMNLVFEFDAGVTNEARFAYQCDKLECDLMAIRYDRQLPVTFENATSRVKENDILKQYRRTGSKTMADFFYRFDKSKYDKNFESVLDEMYFYQA